MGALLGRCFRVAFPVLVAADIWLVRLGIVSLATVALLESVLLLVAGVQLVRVALRYRRERANGRDIWTALEDGFAVLLPRQAARLLALGIYGAVWVLGYAGSLSVLPHRLTVHGVYLRHGFLAEAYIPYEAIAEVRLEQRASPNGRDGCLVDPSTRAAYLAVGGNTHATLRLREPQTLRRILTDAPPVTTICVAVDEPQRFTEALTARITAAGSEALVGSQIMPS